LVQHGFPAVGVDGCAGAVGAHAGVTSARALGVDAMNGNASDVAIAIHAIRRAAPLSLTPPTVIPSTATVFHFHRPSGRTYCAMFTSSSQAVHAPPCVSSRKVHKRSAYERYVREFAY
jgi:hypothetical protein